ncbi:MAG TPA: hypothetical protein VGM37_06975 [Armatimonadota bacterium]|jgi:RNase H-fold protein (predicted Holliday junction resolvase)
MPVEPVVLAIDPGRGKCGLAVVYRSGQVAEQCIVPRSELPAAVQEVAGRFPLRALVLGDRTGCKDARRDLGPLVTCPIVLVEEHETTLRARDRYYRENPPRGLKRFAPRGMLTPPRPLDDYAAVLLAERFWQAHASEGQV